MKHLLVLIVLFLFAVYISEHDFPRIEKAVEYLLHSTEPLVWSVKN